MKFRIIIAFRIGVGFGIIIIAVIISAFLGYRTIQNIRIQNQSVSETLDPSIDGISSFREKVHSTEDLFSRWCFSDRDNESSLLSMIQDIQQQDIPEINKTLTEESETWSLQNREKYLSIYVFLYDSLLKAIDDMVKTTDKTIPEETGTDELFKYYSRIESLYNHVYAEIDILYSGFEEILSEATDEIDEIFVKSGNYIIIIQLIIALTGLIIAVLLTRSLIRPINKIKKVLLELGKGDLPETNLPGGTDEVGQMATALNSLILNLKLLSNFSQEIGKGNYNSDFQPLSKKDILGNSLLRMREDLKNAAFEEEKRKEEDEIRNWSTQGIARFSEILREYAGNFDELTFQIISNLVKYLGASAGGLFLITINNKGEKYLELIASYAFDRRKYLKKQILIGEGLTGRAVQEGESIYMTDIPEDYIKIKSGLGENRPRSLLIVPLKLNEEIHGAVEIASLKDFMPHQIEFVERICNSIASSLSSIKMMSKDDDLTPLSIVLSDDIPEDTEKLEQMIKKVHFIKDQLSKRENELKDRITDKKSE